MTNKCGECGTEFPDEVEFCPNHKAAEITVEKSGVWGVWYGGSSYSPGGVIRDLEYWEDETEAKGALLDRYRHGDWQEQAFSYVNSEPVSARCPSVGEDSEIHLYRVAPVYGDDYYPDAILTLVFNDEDEVEAVSTPAY
jgi:hypothetical protein